MSRTLRNSLGGKAHEDNTLVITSETDRAGMSPIARVTPSDQQDKPSKEDPTDDFEQSTISHPSSTAQASIHPTSYLSATPLQGNPAEHEIMVQFVETAISKALTVPGDGESEIVKFNELPKGEREKAVESLASLFYDVLEGRPTQVEDITVAAVQKGEVKQIMAIRDGVPVVSVTAAAATDEYVAEPSSSTTRKPRRRTRRRRAARMELEAGIVESAGNGDLSIKGEWALKRLGHISEYM